MDGPHKNSYSKNYYYKYSAFIIGKITNIIIRRHYALYEDGMGTLT